VDLSFVRARACQGKIDAFATPTHAGGAMQLQDLGVTRRKPVVHPKNKTHNCKHILLEEITLLSVCSR